VCHGYTPHVQYAIDNSSWTAMYKITLKISFDKNSPSQDILYDAMLMSTLYTTEYPGGKE